MAQVEKSGDTWVIAIVAKNIQKVLHTVYYKEFAGDEILITFNKSLAKNFELMPDAMLAAARLSHLTCYDYSREEQVFPGAIYNVVIMRQVGGEIPF